MFQARAKRSLISKLGVGVWPRFVTSTLNVALSPTLTCVGPVTFTSTAAVVRGAVAGGGRPGAVATGAVATGAVDVQVFIVEPLPMTSRLPSAPPNSAGRITWMLILLVPAPGSV